jgi:hypothetical protein
MKGYVKLFYFEDLLLGKGTSVGFEPGNSLCHDGFPVRARGLYEWTVHKRLCQRIRLHLALRATYEEIRLLSIITDLVIFFLLDLSYFYVYLLSKGLLFTNCIKY